MYLDIVNNPGTFPYIQWGQAASMLAKFTNDTAVTGIKRAYTTLSHADRYWDEHTASSLTRVNFETIMKKQPEG